MGHTIITEPSGAASVDTDPGVGYVSVRDSWSGSWQTVRYLRPVKSHYRAAPAMSSATLEYNYGRIKRVDQSAFATYSLQDLNGKYCRISAAFASGDLHMWYGVIDDDSLKLHSGSAGYPQGDQFISAYGLEHLLDRYTVSVAKADQGGASKTLDRIPAFNRRNRRGGSLLGNRSSAEGSDDVFEFSKEASVWTNKDIAEALLEWNLPSGVPSFELAGQSELLDKIEAVHQFPAGLSLRQALNRLIDRRRGLGWCIWVDESGTVQVWVYSILDQAISVGGETIAANTEQFTMELDGDRTIQEAVAVQHSSKQYQRVRVVGNFLKSIFTIAFADSTMQARFSGTIHTTYKDGAKNATDYDSQTDRVKAQWNDEYRGEDRFDVLGQFRMPTNWDGESGDGAGGGTDVAIPTIGDDGVLDESTVADIWLYDKAFLHYLPGLEAGKDYSADPASDIDATDQEPEFRRPFVIIKDGTRYVYVDKLAEREELALPNATVRMLDRELALAVDIKPRHLLMKNRWSSAEISYYGNEEFDSDQVLDYQELLATVALETDQRVKVVAESETVSNGRELLIEVSDAELVYLAPNTVVGIDDDGALQGSGSSGRLLVDDRDRLTAIAALASAWYSRPRASLKIIKKGVGGMGVPGMMVLDVRTASDSREAGTVITEETIIWSDGGKGPITTVATQYANLDFASDFGPELPTKHDVGREIRQIKADQQELNQRTGGLVSRIGGGGGAGAGGGFDTVRVATTANITLSGTQTIDGVSLSEGDAVLVKDQSTASENGIYAVASGDWTKNKRFDSSNLHRPILVGAGDTQKQLWFLVTADNTVAGMGAVFL